MCKSGIAEMKIMFWLFFLALCSCSVAAERQDWEFVQSVGGIVVGGQDKNPNWLHLRGDVSGLHEFTFKPKQLNSALALKEVYASASDGVINVYISTTLISKKYNNTKIEGVDISGVQAGKYIVKYLNKNGSSVEIGTVSIQR